MRDQPPEKPQLTEPATQNIAAIAALERAGLAEQELTAMLQMLNALCERMGVAVPARTTAVEQLVKETDIHQLASALDRELTEGAATAPASAPAPHMPSPHRP